ncbi:aldolase, partial [Rhizobium leguminosarum]
MTGLEIPTRNLMKAKMEAGELAVGMIVRLMRNVEIAAIAKSAGFDCLYIDLEHGSFSLETVSQISMTAAALGVT